MREGGDSEMCEVVLVGRVGRVRCVGWCWDSEML